MLIATAGGILIGTIWYDSRQSAWNTWWETASYTGGVLGGATLVFWEDPPPVRELPRALPGRGASGARPGGDRATRLDSGTPEFFLALLPGAGAGGSLGGACAAVRWTF